ncbi:MAG: NAD(P)H-dependent oxidoreductase, partial [Natronomonas sp.]
MTDIRVAALVGSLRDDSYTRLACEEALDAAGEFDGIETDCIDLRTLDLPVYDADEDDAGDAE